MRNLLMALLCFAAAPAGAASRVEKTAARLAAALIERLPEKGASVAVMTFENSQGRPVELGRALADAVSLEFVRSGKVVVQDRAYLSRMLGEIKLGMSGLADPKAALEVGRFSSAKYLVVGSIEAGEREATVSARLVLTESATLAASARQTLKLDAGLKALLSREAVIDPGNALFSEENLGSDAVFLERPGTNGCRWIEARADVPAGSGHDQGHAAALSLARRKAATRLEGRAPGPSPDFSESAFQGQLEELLRATRSGRVEAETVVSEARKGGRHLLTLESCLKPAKAGTDLRVELMLNQTRFIEGQEARAILSVNRSARIYLFSADFADQATLLFPGASADDNHARAGRPLVFPDEAQRARNVRMTAQLPAGKSSSVEMLRVVAVEGEPGAVFDGATSWNVIVRRLEDAGLAWSEDVRVFAVYAR